MDELAYHERLQSEKLAALAELAAGAGHEINNPLAVIAGRAQLLARDEPDAGRRRDLLLIQAQAMRIHEMIADMMLFARPPEPRRTSVDLGKLVEAIRSEVEPLARERDIRLAIVGETQGLSASVDPDQMKVALRALCDNALEAVGRGGRIELSARLLAGGETKPQVEIAVSDDGPGIPDEIRRHMFDPFFSGRQAGRGIGMGLSKAWRIVERHGGTLEAAAGSGPGARLVIRLPHSP